jgi:NAD(P)-dependent dehydrogenase (short-subunit alcohol dehydrogenase family)
MTERKKVAAVAGVGPGIGAALARRCAKAGYAVAMLARNRNTLDALEREIESARGYPCDVGSADSVAHAFAAIGTDLGQVEVLLYNAGSGVFGDVESITPEQFEGSWRVNAYGALLCARAVIPTMKAAASGSIIFTGATASRRGGRADRRFCSGQGSPTKPGGVDGALPLAFGHSCLVDHCGRSGRSSQNAPSIAR